MKVLMYEPSGIGGMKIYTEGLCEGLTSAGISVDILTNCDAEYIDVKYGVIRKLRNPGKFVPTYKWPIDRLMRNIYNGLVRSWVSSEMYDICHIQLFSPVVDWFLIKFINIPFVITLHDIELHEKHCWERKWQRKIVYNNAHGIIVHTYHNRNEFLRQFNIKLDKLHVIPHGFIPLKTNFIDKEEARKILSLPQDYHIALFFGVIRRYKGLVDLLKAFSYTKDWFLVVAGMCNDISKYKSMANEFAVGERIHWDIRFLPEDIVPYYFIAADVVVLPYKSNFESQSGVLFQAYRYHRPVVVTDVGGLGETVSEDKSGIVVPPNSPIELANAMYETVNMQKTVDWKRIEDKYSWHKLAEDIIKLYNMIIFSNI